MPTSNEALLRSADGSGSSASSERNAACVDSTARLRIRVRVRGVGVGVRVRGVQGGGESSERSAGAPEGTRVAPALATAHDTCTVMTDVRSSRGTAWQG